MLQGALADVQQPAHISVVQPVRVFAFLSECPVTAFRKAQDFVSKLCPVDFRNDVIVHNHILLLFNVSSTNPEQSKPCIDSPLYIDTRLLWKQAIGRNGP